MFGKEACFDRGKHLLLHSSGVTLREAGVFYARVMHIRQTTLNIPPSPFNRLTSEGFAGRRPRGLQSSSYKSPRRRLNPTLPSCTKYSRRVHWATPDTCPRRRQGVVTLLSNTPQYCHYLACHRSMPQVWHSRQMRRGQVSGVAQWILLCVTCHDAALRSYWSSELTTWFHSDFDDGLSTCTIDLGVQGNLLASKILQNNPGGKNCRLSSLSVSCLTQSLTND